MTQIFFFKSATGVYRIGISTDAPLRLRELQRCEPVSLCGWFQTAAPASECERAIDGLLGAFRSQGEWYASDDRSISDILGTLAKVAARIEMAQP